MDNTIRTDQDIEVYEDKIYMLCDDYINAMYNPDDIYTNNGLFVDMLKYIYRNYIGDLLNNKDSAIAHRYKDIKLLDNLFNIYTHLVYKYKANKKPLISEYSIFTNVSRDIIHDWKTGNRREVSPEYVHAVKNWYQECENALVNQGGVFEIFQLKACYNWNDNLAAIPLDQQNRTQTVEALPDLGLHNAIESRD